VEIEEVKVVSFWINIIDFVSNNSPSPQEVEEDKYRVQQRVHK
jgi:hypothetical protein